ncbi:MAG: hypothetical protein H6557_14805 [Lewinellaceae bacterium]|nr:hypothetical protein [Phaeodactylibacter sp.]MCB9037883.1 hypothetical protein [Lewinellaceae bacterium]
MTSKRKEDLKGSRQEIKRKIRTWFKDNKPQEIQPKFYGQGSFEMNTTVNPIPEHDDNGNRLLKYDLDYGVYFLEEGEDNRKGIATWHDWIYESVDNHTNQDTIRKTTCIRVVFADGHHIDLPIYYKNSKIPELAHRSKGWIESDPKQFTEWFLKEADGKAQLVRIVRYLKAWKNYQENKYSNLKLASGFELTILAVEYYVPCDNDDEAFRYCIDAMSSSLHLPGGFRCIRPTTPVGENLFEEYPETRKNNFLDCLSALSEACQKADEEPNFKKASEHIREQFGDRFPWGEDKDERTKSEELSGMIAGSGIVHKPYHG